MKYQVTGSVVFNFDIEVEADSEDAAMIIAEEKDYADLIERAPPPRIDPEDCFEISPRKKRRVK